MMGSTHKGTRSKKCSSRRTIRRGVGVFVTAKNVSFPCELLLNVGFDKVFVILCLTLSALPSVRLDQNGCESISPPCPLNARLIASLVNTPGYKIQCDEGFLEFGDPEVICTKGKWKSSGYCATNVAANRPTNQSSTVSTPAAASNPSSGKQMSHFANDGSISTCSQTLKELNPFWKIDLLQNHHVTGIRISVGNAAVSTSQSVDLEVRVGNNPLGVKNPLCVWQPASEFLPDEKKLFACARPIQGRHLSIQIIGSESVLKLCEVEVFATDGIPSQRCSPETTVAEDIVSFNGSCFEFATKSGQTFSGARSQCVARKGDLLTENHLKPNSPNQYLVTTTLDVLKPGLKRPLIWIGVERDPGFTSRTWRWIDSGLLVKKPNWGKEQPNNYNGEQNCAVLDGGRDWTWNDVGCGLDLFHWICVFPPKRCGSPDYQEGTELVVAKDDYLVGSTLMYRCSKPGYFLESGDSTRICQQNGLWNGTCPSCKFVDCGDEPLKNKIENGEIILPGNNSTYYGAKIMYKCITGFTFSEGQETRTCTREGKWSGAEPKCLNSICPDPPEIVNGTFKASGKTAGSSVTYSCNAAHILIGSSVLRCQLGGKYDNSPPMCKFITCGDLPNLSNGTFNLMNNSEGAPTPILGSVAVASCDLNFELSDESSNRIVCSERGHWEMMGNFGSRTPIWTTLIKCQLIVCDEPEVPNGSFVTGYDFSVGSEIQYHCEEGHVMVGGTEIRRCTLMGTWSGLAPQCRFIDCGRSQTIPFGQAVYPSGKTYLDSTVQYSCAPNYRLSGPGTRTCTANGGWSGSTPSCLEVRCSFPHLPPSSVATVAKNDRFNTQSLLTAESASQQNLNTTFRIGTILKLRCERGYVLEGDKMQTCNGGGVWSTSDKTMCKFVDCGDLPEIANGKKSCTSNTTVFGSAVIYECLNGYTLIGNSRRLCLENSTWSGSEPYCREITCEAVESTNATVDYTNFQVGGLAKYSCGKGKFLLGDATRQCSDRGKWSGQSPTCQYVKCSPPPAATNARQFLVNVSTVYSAMVEYHCIPGYSISPGQASILTCSEFGKWDPPSPPTCLNHEEFTAVSKQQNENASSDSSSSVVGVIVGLAIGFVIVTGVLFFLLWHIRQRRNEKNTNDIRRSEPTKGEPMVVFPTPTSSSLTSTSSSFMGQPQQHYYDNPTVEPMDPIYENLDDYGVTSSSSDIVTINGVSVS
ncbi:sushi, von Willebrand factor type A, EGF and pentraxin domain-containing protein 1 isoform X1 [Folsomia candida]|uniref:sushi, von Willebrand factor type A, EGF and pentraxin domain-containing protein 1 isoform X1 n=1 Tax=Folsomia candida TaxID=158441 RepID=UPI000B9029D0|nr:sushi, von Willebrand factor type A, EGF and pentraxin domain-containing protein 1 isoform X1 [Folsomia candida]XP_035710065.1 sushi, von Willebrand factor type A, EGF and pentraxin domain-containing protein 1 isoform X1 [Folsomia candida]